MTEQTTPTFESAFASLQKVIEALENSELPLEEALRLYEEGMKLSVLCTNLLENAQLRVTQLSAAATPPEDKSADE